MTGLERAIRDEDSSQIRKLLNKNNLNRPDSEGITPLLSAAIHGRIKSAKAILKRGADVNKADNSGNTPLMFAAKNGNLELLQLLLYFSADVSLRSKAGKTAFDLAEFNDRHECLSLLNSQVTNQSYRVGNKKEAINEDAAKKEKNRSIIEDKSGAKELIRNNEPNIKREGQPDAGKITLNFPQSSTYESKNNPDARIDEQERYIKSLEIQKANEENHSGERQEDITYIVIIFILVIGALIAITDGGNYGPYTDHRW